MGEKLKKEKNFYFFQEINCSYKNKNEDNLNEKLNGFDNQNKNNKIDENDLVQNLFFKIGKIIYKEYIDTKIERVNSSVYNYEASNSILAASETQSSSTNKKHKSCFC